MIYIRHSQIAITYEHMGHMDLITIIAQLAYLMSPNIQSMWYLY